MINYIKGESLSKIWTNIKNYVTAKISTKAEDDEVVKLTGAQSVSGQKTFKSNVIVENSNPLFLIKNSTVNKGTNPSTNVYCGMWLNDKNGIESKNRVAGLGCEINTAGRYRSYLCAYKPLENDTTYSQIAISYSSDGTISTSTPTPPANDNSTQIANTSWCRANLVTKDSTQTITGSKTFSNGLAFDDTRDAVTLWKKIKADKGEVLTTDQTFEFLLSDNTGNTNWVNRLAYIRMWYSKDTGNTNASIGVFSSKDNTISTNSQISIQYDKANNKYITSAPTPPINDNSTQIATTSFVNTAIKNQVSELVNSAPATLDTLNELASALGNDPNFATTFANQIGSKANDSTVVHKTGNETISGQKTINQPLIFNNTTTSYAYLGSLRTVAFAKGDDITGYYNQYNGFTIVTANTNSRNENRFILVDGSVQSNGNTSVGMHAFSTKAGSTYASISVGYNRASDTFTTYAPTPPSGDNSTQIATTEWVRALLAEKGL